MKFALLLLSACAQQALTLHALKSAPKDKPRIVVIKSGNNPLYDQPVAGFTAAIDADVIELTLDDRSSDDAAVALLTQRKPALVFALGTRAAVLASKRLPNTPVVCSMVVDYRGQGLDTLRNVTGVALETPPAQEFAQFKMLLPKLRRVLVLHSRSSLARVNEARQALATLDIELEAVALDRPREITQAVATRARGIDAVWLMNDPIAFNRKSFALLKEAADEAGVPILASLSESLAEAGALATVSFDATSLGAQAAALARGFLGKTSGGGTGFHAPISMQLTLNVSVAKHLYVDIPSDVLPLVRTIGLESEQR